MARPINAPKSSKTQTPAKDAMMVLLKTSLYTPCVLTAILFMFQKIPKEEKSVV
jgi:hypothetical protein